MCVCVCVCVCVRARALRFLIGIVRATRLSKENTSACTQAGENLSACKRRDPLTRDPPRVSRRKGEGSKNTAVRACFVFSLLRRRC